MATNRLYDTLLTRPCRPSQALFLPTERGGTRIPSREERMAHTGRCSERRMDLDRVLAGHVSPTARELIALIHEVNPTGRESDKREAVRRYAIKTRLQSLLIERFSDELAVVADAQEGVVLLRHKYLGLAASHAIVADLEDEARAWVQMQLDLGVIEDAWTQAPGALERRQQARRPKGQREPSHDRPHARIRDRPQARPDEPPEDRVSAVEMVAALDAGRIAQARYDYEAARGAFERAHALAPEAPAPLAALFDLLVNRLGLDREALDLAEAAPSAALHSRTARAALALAAARLQDRARADDWARDLDGAEAAEVFRTLAAGAIDAGDLAYATEALHRARRNLPGDAERILVEARLDRARAATVACDEARLARLVAAGDRTAASELAHQIVQRHPGSPGAHAVLKDVATHERHVRQQGRLDEARAAVLHARFKQARQALASARACGASAMAIAEVERTLVAAEAQAARIAHERMLDTVAARLASPVPANPAPNGAASASAMAERRAALASYLGLADQDREAIRRRCQAEELAWLDELPPGIPPARREPIAAAVMAARAASAMLDAGDLDGAERVLGAHRPVLGEHGLGQKLLARLAEAHGVCAQVRAVAALDRAAVALRARDVRAAKDLFDGIVRDRLPSSAHETWDRLAQALAQARQHAVCMDLVDERLAKQRPIVARQLLLEQLAQSREETESALLRDRLREVDAVVRKAHVGIDYVPPPGTLASEATEMVTNYGFDRGVDTLLLPGGKTAVLLSAGQAHYAARLVDVDSGEIRRVLSWAMMEALMPRSIGLTDGRLWIQDVLFNYAEISCDDWMPCRQCELRPDSDPANTLGRCVAVPGSDVVWIKTEAIGSRHKSRLLPLDIAHGSVIDFADDEGDMYLIPGTLPPVLACFSSLATFVLVSARGKDEAFIDIPPTGVAIGIALAPSGDGYVVLCESKDEADPWLELLLTDAMGVERARVRLPVAHAGGASVATVLPKRLVCVAYRARGSARRRVAYVREQDPGQMVLAADVDLPGLEGLAQDPTASTAVAVCKSAHGVRLARLDDMPTTFPAGYDDFVIPRMFGFAKCSPSPEPEWERRFLSAEYDWIRESNPDFADSKLEELADHVDQSLAAVSTYHLLRLRNIHGRADRLLAYMEKKSTRNYFVRLAIAEREALAGRWVGDGLEQEAEAAGEHDHLLHVRMVAYVREGRLDEVIEGLAGRTAPGACRLAPLLTLARTLKAELAGEPTRAEEMARPSLAALVRSIFAADRALARGERDEVLRILDQAWIREQCEAQSIARLANVYLATGKVASPQERFRASTLMSDFIYNNHLSGVRIHQLWLGESTWSADRIAKVFEDAQRWMVRFVWKSSAS